MTRESQRRGGGGGGKNWQLVARFSYLLSGVPSAVIGSKMTGPCPSLELIGGLERWKVQHGQRTLSAPVSPAEQNM